MNFQKIFFFLFFLGLSSSLLFNYQRQFLPFDNQNITAIGSDSNDNIYVAFKNAVIQKYNKNLEYICNMNNFGALVPIYLIKSFSSFDYISANASAEIMVGMSSDRSSIYIVNKENGTLIRKIQSLNPFISFHIFPSILNSNFVTCGLFTTFLGLFYIDQSNTKIIFNTIPYNFITLLSVYSIWPQPNANFIILTRFSFTVFQLGCYNLSANFTINLGLPKKIVVTTKYIALQCDIYPIQVLWMRNCLVSQSDNNTLYVYNSTTFFRYYVDQQLYISSFLLQHIQYSDKDYLIYNNKIIQILFNQTNQSVLFIGSQDYSIQNFYFHSNVSNPYFIWNRNRTYEIGNCVLGQVYNYTTKNCSLLSCFVARCVLCTVSPYKCTTCIEGYFYIYHQCLKNKCQDYCLQCAYLSTCAFCEHYFAVNQTSDIYCYQNQAINSTFKYDDNIQSHLKCNQNDSQCLQLAASPSFKLVIQTTRFFISFPFLLRLIPFFEPLLDISNDYWFFLYRNRNFTPYVWSNAFFHIVLYINNKKMQLFHLSVFHDKQTYEDILKKKSANYSIPNVLQIDKQETYFIYNFKDFFVSRIIFLLILFACCNFYLNHREQKNKQQLTKLNKKNAFLIHNNKQKKIVVAWDFVGDYFFIFFKNQSFLFVVLQQIFIDSSVYIGFYCGLQFSNTLFFFYGDKLNYIFCTFFFCVALIYCLFVYLNGEMYFNSRITTSQEEYNQQILKLRFYSLKAVFNMFHGFVQGLFLLSQVTLMSFLIIIKLFFLIFLIYYKIALIKNNTFIFNFFYSITSLLFNIFLLSSFLFQNQTISQKFQTFDSFFMKIFFVLIVAQLSIFIINIAINVFRQFYNNIYHLFMISNSMLKNKLSDFDSNKLLTASDSKFNKFKNQNTFKAYQISNKICRKNILQQMENIKKQK